MLVAPRASADYATEFIMQSILSHGKEAIAPYQNPSMTVPDASFVLQLPDEVFTGSTVYAVQKIFDGPFQFDVFFESASAHEKLSCMSHGHLGWPWQLM